MRSRPQTNSVVAVRTALKPGAGILRHTRKIGRPGLQEPNSFLPPVPSALTEIPDDSHHQRRQGANEGPKESSRGCFHTLSSLSVAERAS